MSTKQLLKLCSGTKKASPKPKTTKRAQAPVKKIAEIKEAPAADPSKKIAEIKEAAALEASVEVTDVTRAKLLKILDLSFDNKSLMLKYRNDPEVWAQLTDFLTLKESDRKIFVARFRKSTCSFDRVFQSMFTNAGKNTEWTEDDGYDLTDEIEVDDDQIADENAPDVDPFEEMDADESDDEVVVAAPAVRKSSAPKVASRELNLAATLQLLRDRKANPHIIKFLDASPVKRTNSPPAPSTLPDTLKFWKKSKTSDEHENVVRFLIGQELNKIKKYEWFDELNKKFATAHQALLVISGIESANCLAAVFENTKMNCEIEETYKYLTSRF